MENKLNSTPSVDDRPASCCYPYLWDCDCDNNYIHSTADRDECPLCFAISIDQPESSDDEARYEFNHFIMPKSMVG
jgi:hypothetical protein